MLNRLIGFIGAGKMAQALITSLLDTNTVGCGQIIVGNRNQEKLELLQKETCVQVAANNIEVAKKSSILFLTVKPQDMDSLLDEIKDTVKEDQIIISIAAGISIEQLESKLKAKVVRVMPNTPCIVGEMAAGYSFGKGIKNDDKTAVEELLNAAGVAIEVEEEKLDAVTGLSGSGPAFVALLIQAFQEAGTNQGLNKEESTKLAVQTFLGTAKLLKEKEISAEELIKIVASPGGTTEKGLEVLNNSNIKELIENAVVAAARRSKELRSK
ncbi:pyrroline-5-carboxylate reductase [Nanoarchaeota archaeon]